MLSYLFVVNLSKLGAEINFEIERADGVIDDHIISARFAAKAPLAVLFFCCTALEAPLPLDIFTFQKFLEVFNFNHWMIVDYVAVLCLSSPLFFNVQIICFSKQDLLLSFFILRSVRLLLLFSFLLNFVLEQFRNFQVSFSVSEVRGVLAFFVCDLEINPLCFQ